MRPRLGDGRLASSVTAASKQSHSPTQSAPRNPISLRGSLRPCCTNRLELNSACIFTADGRRLGKRFSLRMMPAAAVSIPRWVVSADVRSLKTISSATFRRRKCCARWNSAASFFQSAAFSRYWTSPARSPLGRDAALRCPRSFLARQSDTDAAARRPYPAAISLVSSSSG